MVQQALLAWGCLALGRNLLPTAGADGRFGRETDRAVRKLQQHFNVAVDGIIGRITLRLLDDIARFESSLKQRIEQAFTPDNVSGADSESDHATAPLGLGNIVLRDLIENNPGCTRLAPAQAESWKRRFAPWFLKKESEIFHPAVAALWEEYLRRRPGDSLAPRIFKSRDDPIVRAFATSSATIKEADNLLLEIERRLPRYREMMRRLKPYVPVRFGLERFFSKAELDNRSIDFDNWKSIPGNIAGGTSSSDAGEDRRAVRGSVLVTKKLGDSGQLREVVLESDFTFGVRDAIDFCPGGKGAPVERFLTIFLSNLEASGLAYDRPYVVVFRPEPRRLHIRSSASLRACCA